MISGKTDDEILETVDTLFSIADGILRSIMVQTLEKKKCGGTATFEYNEDGGLKVDGMDWMSATEQVVLSPLKEEKCGRCLPSSRRLF